MRNKFLTLLLFSAINILCAQTGNSFYDTEHSFAQNFPVAPKQRKVISIELPEGTTSILYRITVGKKNQQVADNLVSAVGSFPSPSAAAAGAVTKLIVSLSSYEAKYYIFPNEQEADNYEKGLKFSYCKTTGELTNATAKMLSNGCFSGSKYLYFGFNTNEILIDYGITLEVVPWIEKEDLTKWTSEYKDELFKSCMEYFITKGLSEKNSNDLSNCTVSKMTAQKTPEDLDNMGESEVREWQKKMAEECIQNFRGGAKTEEQQKGNTYGSLGWKAYQNGEIDKAIEYSKKALTYDNTLGWVFANLGLFSLIKKDEIAATDYYVDAISNIKKDKLTAKKTIKEVMGDITTALQKYPDLKGYKEILQQLQQEYNKL